METAETMLLIAMGLTIVIFNKKIALASFRSWGTSITYDAEKDLGPYRIFVVFVGGLILCLGAAKLVGF